MLFQLITLFPEMFSALDSSITGRARQKRIIQCQTINPRDFTNDKHKTVDDRPFGGGPGMVMKYQPLADAIGHAKAQIKLASQHKVVYLSPQGQPFNQAKALEFSKLDGLILLSGRYEGIDERLIEDHIDEEISIGDYVLSGGELASMVLIDAITRLLPGALGHADSAIEDSFTNGLLDCPHYTRPEQIQGKSVPEVLLSGDHQAIKAWRAKQSLIRTWQRRPNLVKRRALSEDENKIIQALQNEQQKD